MHKEFTVSLNDLQTVVTYLEQQLPNNAIIFLTGDLAAGKTTLSSAIAKSRGIVSGATSPTFSLQQCYGEGLFHYDLYRISNNEFFEMGLHEEFEKEGWHLVEWADDALKTFLENAGYNTSSITITPTGEKRHYFIEV
ncbi:MAG: tRNA (adenosine(37)-N6)-threonylcarbamoyltransferase complex ATPase subunit type 1 TsaE [Campylobacterota bacterium]|nr:tRNA (adenosine(37)-N6)-threonylcarbamoyltransferase complex ATPase subunit type 1 TsaE [Campylobacterota bacterium]